MILNWTTILENSLGNLFADIVVGFFLVFTLTRYFDRKNNLKDAIGVLKNISAEIQYNKNLLTSALKDGFEDYEKRANRGKANEISQTQAMWTDMVEYMAKHVDSAMSFGVLHNNWGKIGVLENEKLTEKIINLYLIGYLYRIKTSLTLGQMNWILFDQFKNAFQQEIDRSSSVIGDINLEIKKLKDKLKFKNLLCLIFT